MSRYALPSEVTKAEPPLLFDESSRKNYAQKILLFKLSWPVFLYLCVHAGWSETALIYIFGMLCYKNLSKSQVYIFCMKIFFLFSK